MDREMSYEGECLVFKHNLKTYDGVKDKELENKIMSYTSYILTEKCF